MVSVCVVDEVEAAFAWNLPASAAVYLVKVDFDQECFWHVYNGDIALIKE